MGKHTDLFKCLNPVAQRAVAVHRVFTPCLSAMLAILVSMASSTAYAQLKGAKSVANKAVSTRSAVKATSAPAVSISFDDFRDAEKKKAAMTGGSTTGTALGGLLSTDQELRYMLGKLGKAVEGKGSAPSSAATGSGAAGSPTAAGGPGGFVSDLSSSSFDREVLQASQPAVVVFWASWCGPCRKFAPVVKSAAGQISSARFGRVNVDECEDLAKRYRVNSLPTVVLFKNGKEMKRFTGGTDVAGLKQLVQAAL